MPNTADQTEATEAPFDLNRIDAIAGNLDLRQPNREALESIVFEVGQHFDIDEKGPPFEAVVDAATGVGKTYIIASTLEYFAAEGVRNFAIIAPGRTILEKTVANFTAGHKKSLLDGMEVEPVIITSDNFSSASMRQAMDDPQKVKLYVFTVQSLMRPESSAGRKTHKFQEGLGQAFYERLQEADDLFVLADEHHAYFGPAFSAAVRDLNPRVLIGLTATPHPRTPEDQIIYRYPLAAAIADELVKTPVIVGRKDDRSDPTTKLTDGASLLSMKEKAVARYCEQAGATPVRPVMLVIAPNIKEAEEIESILNDKGFADGTFVDAVLTVHSNKSDEALAELDKLEEPGTPYRVVISVGMLKEGWDVKSVYVICSLRASVSTLLTEQTLGRGLRLPFGQYTGVPLLDQLEVLAHERYEQLLKKAGVINEQFIDRRTRAVLREDSFGNLVSTVETTDVKTPVVDESEGEAQPGTASVGTVEGQTKKGEKELEALDEELEPRAEYAPVRIPRLRMSPVESKFSLADITDTEPFRKLGQRLASDPEAELRRMTVSAKIIQGDDGIRRTVLVTAPAVDKVESPAKLFPIEELRDQLLERVLSSPAVPARAGERAKAGPLIQAFLDGLGDSADELLSGYFDRAAAGLLAEIGREQKRFATKPSFDEVIEVIDFGPTRAGKPETSEDRVGKFKRGVAYAYKRSLYEQDWFDSSTERSLANVLEDEKDVKFFVRLQIGDLPILFAEGRNYNPDFVVVEEDGHHWVVETKMNKEMSSEVVQNKRDAARRWANHVSAADEVNGTKWGYLLLSENDVKTAKGSWSAMKKLAS